MLVGLFFRPCSPGKSNPVVGLRAGQEGEAGHIIFAPELPHVYYSTGPFGSKFHLWHPCARGLEVCGGVFYGNWLFSLVAMVT